MSEAPFLSVVVPVFNEEESVSLLCERIHASVSTLGRSYEVLLIDDGSSDRTWERLKTLIRGYPHFVIIRLRRNFGQTAAMAAGFHHAKGEVIVTLDADLQNDPADIPLLLAKMGEGFDVVSGWRKDRQDAFINRKLPSMMANWIIGRFTGVPLHDYGCTLKAYRREIMQDVHLYGELHRFIPALAAWVGARVAEVPVRHHARQFGKSKYGISRTFRVVLDLMNVKFLLSYSTRPIQIFGRIGLIFGAISIVMIMTMLLTWLVPCLEPTGGFLHKRPAWIIVPLMFLGFCIQFIAMGLMAELQTRVYFETQDRRIYQVRETILSADHAG